MALAHNSTPPSAMFHLRLRPNSRMLREFLGYAIN
jgi:hypothetical protein